MTSRQMIKVRCKHCDAMNDKRADQYRVKCTVCGKETAYFVIPRPQPKGKP